MLLIGGSIIIIVVVVIVVVAVVVVIIIIIDNIAIIDADCNLLLVRIFHIQFHTRFQSTQFYRLRIKRLQLQREAEGI